MNNNWVCGRQTRLGESKHILLQKFLILPAYITFDSDSVILQFGYIIDDLSVEKEGGGTAFVKGELVYIAFETGEKAHVIDFEHNDGSIDTQYPTEETMIQGWRCRGGWKIKDTALTQIQYGI